MRNFNPIRLWILYTEHWLGQPIFNMASQKIVSDLDIRISRSSLFQSNIVHRNFFFLKYLFYNVLQCLCQLDLNFGWPAAIKLWRYCGLPILQLGLNHPFKINNITNMWLFILINFFSYPILQCLLGQTQVQQPIEADS